MVRHRFVTRNPLITALLACADEPLRARSRRFLQGLSFDELQFLAGFLGACILESSEDIVRAAHGVHLYESRMARASLRRSDHEHKMILLREFLSRSGREFHHSAGLGPAEAA
jgi:hypothetical protein